jgi:hypothetical protein
MSFTGQTFLADSHRNIVGAGNVGDLRNPLLDGVEIANGDLVGEADVLRSVGLLEPGVNDIGADRLDLVADVTLSGERHGDHQHDARAADNNAEHGKRRAQLIGAQCFDRQVGSFAPVHASARIADTTLPYWDSIEQGWVARVDDESDTG